MATVNNKRVVGVGHSHVVAIANAFYKRQESGWAGEGVFACLNDPPYDPNLLGDDARINPAITEILLRNDPDMALLSIGGNEHNIASLLLTAPPYDFVLSDEPTLRIKGLSHLLPEKVVISNFRRRLRPMLDLARAIRRVASYPMALLEPPAPLARAHVVAHPGDLLRPGQTEAAIAADILRVKYWRLQTKFYRELAAEIGLIYVAAPSYTRGPDGMLVQEASGNDATHANAWFGEHMLEAAFDLCNNSAPHETAS